MDEQFQLLFEKMKIEMQNQAVSISNTIMDRIDEKLKPVLEENKKLIFKVENLEKKIEFLERDKKGNNIIIYGLKEGEKSTRELIENAKNKFQKELNLVLEDYDINKIYRIGKPNKGDKPRPVLLSFTCGWKKNEVLKNRKKSKELFVAEDFSKEILEKRKALLPKLIEERNKGNIAYLKFDKLIVKEGTKAKENRKRELSVSPLTNLQQKKQQTASFSRNNRTNAFDFMRNRSNSLTTYLTDKK